MLVSWKRREEFNRRPPLGSPLTALGHAPGPSHNWIPGRGWERSDKAGENFHTKAQQSIYIFIGFTRRKYGASGVFLIFAIIEKLAFA